MNSLAVVCLLALLAASFSTTTAVNSAADRLGCFEDNGNRVFKQWRNNNDKNNARFCKNMCRQDFKFAGLQDGTRCFCGDALPPTQLDRSRCQTQCPSLAGKTCGGPWALEVLELSEAQAPLQVVGCVPLDYQARDDLGTYKLYTQRLSWDEAWQRCEDDDAHLLIINSEDEAKYVRSLFAQVPSETRMHAGFHDLLRRGIYRTLFGTSLPSAGYNVWSAQYPQRPSSAQHCGAVDVRAQLAQIDGNCAAQALFVCEKKADSPDAQGQPLQFDVRGAFAAN